LIRLFGSIPLQFSARIAFDIPQGGIEQPALFFQCQGDERTARAARYHLAGYRKRCAQKIAGEWNRTTGSRFKRPSSNFHAKIREPRSKEAIALRLTTWHLPFRRCPVLQR